MSDTRLGIVELFGNRKKFIIIGLTGRTGSGCTTVAQLLSKDWNDFKAPKSMADDSSINEARKYKIAFNFSEKNWRKFHVIQIRDVITSFIIENDLIKFRDFLYEQESLDKETLSSEFNHIENDYEEYHKKIIGFNNFNKYKDDIKKTKEKLNFYLEDIPKFSDGLKKILQGFSKNKYNRIYQTIGDNIRLSGCATEKKFEPSNIFSIAKRTNDIIKMLRAVAKCNESNENEVFVVIDAIRNPFEATFFKDRYSAFYMISINTENESRIKRLQKQLDLSLSEIKSIDDKEYENKPREEMVFVSQDIKKCIEISDIYFHNPQLGQCDLTKIKNQLVWYISLIMHPGIITPTAYERAMQVAYSAKLNSGCISRQVGAIITDQNLSIKAVGWNNTPQGQVPCILRSAFDLNKSEDKSCYSEYENDDDAFRKLISDLVEKVNINQELLQGRNLSFCFKDIRNSIDIEKNQVHTRSLHAEENAFLQISKYGGTGIEGGKLFTTASPCELCSKKAYQLGIKEIIYIDPYPGIANNHILASGEKGSRPTLRLFSGAIGRAYHQLYQPILPYKDELQMLIKFKWKNKVDELNSQIQELKDKNKELEKKLSEKSNDTSAS